MIKPFLLLLVAVLAGVPHAGAQAPQPGGDAETAAPPAAAQGAAAAAAPSLSFDGAGFHLAFSQTPRFQVFDILFSNAGVGLEWHDKATALEVISGQLDGSMDQLASVLLAETSYIAAYDTLHDVPRLVGLKIFGRRPPGESPPPADIVTGPVAGSGAGTAGCAAGAASETAIFISPAATGEGGRVAGLKDHAEMLLDNGSVLFAGGIDSCTGRYSNESELLDPKTNQFKRVGNMGVGRAAFLMHKLPSGDVIAIGGETAGAVSGATDRIERFDVATGKWTAAGHLALRKAGGTICTLKDGDLLIVGGTGRGAEGGSRLTRSAEIFSPATNSATKLDALTNFEHASATKALAMPDGRCVIASNGAGLQMEVYDSASRKFKPLSVPPEIAKAANGLAQLGLLPDGTVLLVAKQSFVVNIDRNTYRPIP